MAGDIWHVRVGVAERQRSLLPREAPDIVLGVNGFTLVVIWLHGPGLRRQRIQ